MLRGIVLGIILTIGGAYIWDSTYAAQYSPSEHRTLVNWDVVGANLEHLATRIQEEWTRLKG